MVIWFPIEGQYLTADLIVSHGDYTMSVVSLIVIVIKGSAPSSLMKMS